jgi:hypothetical protein
MSSRDFHGDPSQLGRIARRPPGRTTHPTARRPGGPARNATKLRGIPMKNEKDIARCLFFVLMRSPVY